MALKATKRYNGKQSVEMLVRDGKYVLEFDDIPALVFVSFDGSGTYDTLILDGERESKRIGLTINSAVNELTTYDMKRYAISWEEDD